MIFVKEIKKETEIKQAIEEGLKKFDLKKLKEPILIKPNFCVSYTAASGATTDFRIIKHVVLCLKKLGYKNIIIGEGNIFDDEDTLEKLGVYKLAKFLKIRAVNLNKDEKQKIVIDGNTYEVSTLALNSTIINIPKLKTHLLTGTTLAQKNLMGCFFRESRIKMHTKGLLKIIPQLSSKFNIALNVMDGIIAMDGAGPIRGSVKRLNLIVMSNDSKEMDNEILHIIKKNNFKIPNLTLSKIKNSAIHLPIIKKLLDIKPISNIVRGKDKTYKAFIDKEICTKCNNCRRACIYNAISEDFVVNPENCVGCGCCVEVCVTGAVSLKMYASKK